MGEIVLKTTEKDNPEHVTFVTALLSNGFNARQAALTLGRTPNSAGVLGHRLLKNDKVRVLIQQALAERGLTEDRMLMELIDIALNGSLEDFWPFLDSGAKPSPKAMRRAKAMTITTTTTTAKDGSSTSRTTRRVELHDRVAVIHKLLDRIAGVVADTVPEGGGEIRETIFEYIRSKVRRIDVGLPSGVAAPGPADENGTEGA